MRFIPHSVSRSSFLLAVMVLFACGAAMAQGPTYKLGRTPTDAEVKAWDHAVGPEGKELPDGSGSAVEGAKLFGTKCSFCHGRNGEGVFPWPKLTGGVGTLNTPNPIRTSGSYLPYATTIWDFINRAMPRDAEGTLSPSDVYALTAFILFKSAIIKDTDVMDKKTLVEVKMPNRDGFFPAIPQAKADKDHSWLPFWDQVKEMRKEDKAFGGN